MKTLNDYLTNYAEYHRDRRNIATHFVGIPMIVLGVAAFLARPQFLLMGVSLSPLWFAVVASLMFYYKVDVRYGLVMTAYMGLNVWAALFIGAQSTSVWLATASTLFVLGWAIQFWGHLIEGKKPAFMDDISNFLVGPLFIVAEAGFFVGMRSELHKDIIARAGPTRNHKPTVANLPQA